MLFTFGGLCLPPYVIAHLVKTFIKSLAKTLCMLHKAIIYIKGMMVTVSETLMCCLFPFSDLKRIDEIVSFLVY